MKNTNILKRLCLFVVLLLLLFVLVFFTSFSTPSNVAYALETYDSISLWEGLSSIANNDFDDYEFVVGNETDISLSDYYGYETIFLNRPIFSNLVDSYGEFNITFNVSITDVFNYDGEDLSLEKHYGLFNSDSKIDGVNILYKINYKGALDSVIGTLTPYYTFNTIQTLPGLQSGYHWEENGTEVSTITQGAWGVKTFTAVKDIEVEPEPPVIPEEPEITTYPIVFENATLENAIYTVGTNYYLSSPSEKLGFTFVEWVSKETGENVQTLNAELDESLLSADKEIVLIATWKLKDISLKEIQNVSKTYDALPSVLIAEPIHDLIATDSLIISYSWEKEGDGTFVNTDKTVSCLNVADSGVYSVTVTATDLESGLQTSVSQENISVNILRKEIGLTAIETSPFEKTYDGNANFSGTLTIGTHLNVEGILDTSEVSVVLQNVKYNASSVKDANKITAVFTLEGETANYTFPIDTLDFPAKIRARTVTISKESNRLIEKPYDGTINVDEAFTPNVDYSLSGVVLGESLQPQILATFNDANVENASSVILAFENRDDNYSLKNKSISFDAKITPITLGVIKRSSPDLNKIYDATNTVDYTFVYGEDFKISGAVEGDIIGVESTAFYVDSKASENTKVLLSLNTLIMKEGVLSSNYELPLSARDMYFDAVIQPKEVELSGRNLSRYYGEEDVLVFEEATGVNEETVNVIYSRESGEDVGSYKYTGVSFYGTPNNNYNLIFAESDMRYTVLPKVIESISFPIFKNIPYSESIRLWDLELIDTEAFTKDDLNKKYVYESGLFYWQNYDITPNVDNVGYVMNFAPTNTLNYDYSKIEDYNSETKLISRLISVSVIPLNPTPAEISESFNVAIGMKYENISLPQGWRFKDTVDFKGSDIAFGTLGSTVTFKDALEYNYDDSGNYQSVYKDFNVNFVFSKILYKMGEEGVLGDSVEVLGNPSEGISIRFTLDNPFEKDGYRVSSWTFKDGSVMECKDDSGYYVGATFIIDNIDLIENEIPLEIVLVARDDIQITFRHFYETLNGDYNLICDKQIIKYGTANTLYTLQEQDVLLEKGFYFVNAILSGEAVESFNISPSGADVLNLFYNRKNINVEYVDSLYGALSPIGKLPLQHTVKFGVPFSLSKPNDYVVYGYDFNGYTDGITYEGEELKLFNDTYTALVEVSKITFAISMLANENTPYKVVSFLGENKVEKIYYGTTGTVADASDLNVLGYEYIVNENEILKGVISGCVLDTEGTVSGGNMLVLYVYYVAIPFEVTMPEILETENLTAVIGDVITLPECPLDAIPIGNSFVGWRVNGTLYKAGDNFTMPAENVLIEPVWQDLNVKEDLPETDDNIDVSVPDNELAVGENVEIEENGGINYGLLFGVIGACIGCILILGTVVYMIDYKHKHREILIYKIRNSRRNQGNNNLR